MHMEKDLIEDNLYQLKDQLKKRKIHHRDFYFVLTIYIHFMKD